MDDRRSTRIAVLIACHNRRNLTVRCLEALGIQHAFRPHDLFLVDDGSIDGTGEAVRTLMPAAHVIQGTGTLFWNGGMRRAWDAARSSGQVFDYFLWLNDDVVLSPGALDRMLADAHAVGSMDDPVIVAGSTVAPGTSRVSYGGHRRTSRSHPLRFRAVDPTGRPEPIDTFSGNVVLVSAAAEHVLGNLDPRFQHIFGDLDYGFRARQAGVTVVLASEITGECQESSTSDGSVDLSASRVERLRRRLASENGVHARDWRRFVRLHARLGPLSFLYTLAPYVRIIANRPN